MDTIVSWLASGDWATRYQAVLGLGKAEGSGDEGELLRASIGDPDYRVRIAAAYVLSHSNVPDAVRWIGRLLLEDDDWLVRESAATYLVNCDPNEAALYLQAALDDEDTAVRLAVATALKRVGDAPPGRSRSV